MLSSLLDSSHISTRIAFSDCFSQSSQIWCQCQNSRFEVFLENSGMAITMVFYQHDGMPIIYPWGLISWDGVDPPTWKHDFRFSSTTVHLCTFTIPVLKSLYMSDFLINASMKSPLWLSPFFRNPEWEILSLPCGICPFDGIVLVVVLKPYLDSAHSKPW
jgi:hypothetical protein